MKYNLYKDGVLVNTIEASESFCVDYCKSNGYTQDVIPDLASTDSPTNTELEQLRADVDYLLMMTEG